MSHDPKELWEFNRIFHSEPNATEIRKNEDGTLYLPISVVQNMLDSIFECHWSFNVTRESFGRKWARGSGIMEAVHPITGQVIKRGGDAAIILTGNLRTDSPRLEAMILLSCAKKFGKCFGRDLNRTKDDAPLPVVKIEKRDATTEEKRMALLIEESEDLKELESYKLVIPASLKKQYQSKLKQLSVNP
jgi:hypothetical protein